MIIRVCVCVGASLSAWSLGEGVFVERALLKFFALLSVALACFLGLALVVVDIRVE